jgi:hypothetical protein
MKNAQRPAFYGERPMTEREIQFSTTKARRRYAMARQTPRHQADPLVRTRWFALRASVSRWFKPKP